MKIKFLIFDTKPPAWAATARDEYAAKIAHFQPFEIKLLKSPAADRDRAVEKRRVEADILLKLVDDRDFLILFDEAGKLAKTSEVFAERLGRVLDSGKNTLVFCIGGPYGFDEKVRTRANELWSLSPLTMNHWVAQIAALEQVYRGFTIRKRLPYHNG